MPDMNVVNLREKLDSFSETWVPKVVGSLNGQYVKVAKLEGEYVWHSHADEDEMFLVVHGELVAAWWRCCGAATRRRTRMRRSRRSARASSSSSAPRRRGKRSTCPGASEEGENQTRSLPRDCAFHCCAQVLCAKLWTEKHCKAVRVACAALAHARASCSGLLLLLA